MRQHRCIFCVLVLAWATVPAVVAQPTDTTLTDTSSSIVTLKQRLENNKWGRYITDFIFVETSQQAHSNTEPQNSYEPFASLAGKVVGEIKIVVLDPFEKLKADTTVPTSKVGRLGNALHIKTQKNRIRKSVFFNQGDTLVPGQLADNERFLRQLPNVVDARIVPQNPTDDTVTLVYYVQDVWSLSFDYQPGSLTNHTFFVTERNLAGLGLQLDQSTTTNLHQEAQSRFINYRAYLAAPNLFGRFFNYNISYAYTPQTQVGQAGFSRPFYTPNTKWAAGAQTAYTQQRYLTGQIATAWQNFYTDAWLGRAISPWWGNAQTKRQRKFIFSARHAHRRFINRPAYLPDSLNSFANSQTALATIGYTYRHYTTERLLFGYGLTEDVPLGVSVGVMPGLTWHEGAQGYVLGATASVAEYFFKKLLFAKITAQVNHKWSGAINSHTLLQANATVFSRLFKIGQGGIRQFATYGLLTAFNYNQPNVLSARISTSLRQNIVVGNNIFAQTREYLSSETLWFSSLKILGFKTAFFVFADLVRMAGPPSKVHLVAPNYNVGAGLRLRNDRLLFGSIQLWVGFNNFTNTFTPTADLQPFRRIPDFELGQPQLINFN